MNPSHLLASRIGGGALVLALAAIGCSSSASSAPDPSAIWPKQVTLRVSPLAADGDGVRLADGAAVSGPGDVHLGQTKVLSLRAPAPTNEIFCSKGKFASLAEVPPDESTCRNGNGNAWSWLFFLSGAGNHELEDSSYIGETALVRDPSTQKLYRMRMLGDAYAEGEASAVFEYEPVP